MSAIQEINPQGPETFLVEAQVSGGQLVVPGTDTTKVNVAAAGATNVLGVAVSDANTPANQTTDGQTVTAAIDRQEVAVAYRGSYRLTCASGVALGELVVAAANGEVEAYVPAGGTTPSTFDQVVGKCVEPGGVTAGNRGRIRLNLG